MEAKAMAAKADTGGYEALLGLDQSLLEAMPAALYVCSVDGVIQRFNNRAAQLWGRAPRAGDTDERYCGSFRLYDLSGNVLPHANTPMEAALRTGEPQSDRQVVIERPDGSRITVLVNIRPLMSPSGKVAGAINCFQDISAAKHTEETLRSAEERHEAVLNAIPAAIYTTDADGHVTYFNRAAAELAGREPVLGKDQWCVSWRLRNPDGSELPLEDCPMAVALKEKRAVRGIEALAQRPDGTLVPFRPYPTPLFDAGGTLTGGINMLVDVTDEQEARRKLDESEARYRRIFDGVHVSIWDQDFSRLMARLDELRADGVVDIRGYLRTHPDALAEAVQLIRVRDVNAYTLELFDVADKAELIGDLEDVILPETEDIFIEEIATLWDGGRRFESEAPLRTRAGRQFDVQLTIAWYGDNCEHALVSILDISKQKAAQRRFQTLNSVAHTVSSDLDLERVVQAVTDSATKVSGAQFGAFFHNVDDDSGERFTLYALSGAPHEAFERFGVPRNTEVFEPTFRGAGIVRSDDIRKDPRYGHNAPHHGMPKGHLPVVSYLAVPVVSRSGEVHGGLFFGHEKPGIFSKETEEIVAGIAAHAAMAIDNSRLLRTAQNELKQRREAELAALRLASIVETSHDAIVSKDLDGVITSWNEGAERLFGYTADEITGKPVTTLFPEESVREEDDILDRIRRGERITPYETVRQRKDGTRVDVSLTVSPVKDAEGRIIGASKIARDVSARKRAEAALARRMTEQSALYRMTDRLHHGTSLQDVFDAALDAVTSALGCERASILLFDEEEVMRFVAWRGLSEGYRRAVDGHSPWTAETRDAVPIYMSNLDEGDLEPELRATIEAENIGALAFIPLFSGGKVVGKFMAYYDQPHHFTDEEHAIAITIARQLGFTVQRMRSDEARQRAQADLRDSNERLQMALEAGGMGAWEWELSSGKVIWSPTLETIHGIEPNSFGGTIEDFKREIHPEDAPTVEAAIEKAAREREPYHMTYRAILPDGSLRWLEAFGRCVEDADGSLKKLIGICMDITQRKEADAQREILIAELSHRVKNTLATVVSIARQSFTQESDTRHAYRSFTARIRALAQTHGRLAEAQWTGVSLRTILNDELAPYRHENGKNMQLAGPEVSLPPKPALALGLAFHELATNAAKYGAFSVKDGRVEIGWELRGNQLHLEWIERDGPPVSPPTKTGFGRLLMERVLADDLSGQVDITYGGEGVQCYFILPITKAWRKGPYRTATEAVK